MNLCRTRRAHLSRRSFSEGGFSLVEVIIAVGIFSIAIATILALLPATTKQAAGSRDIQTAARLPDAVKLQLQQTLGARDLTTFAGTLPVNLVAARDGTDVRIDPLADDKREQYFRIVVAKFPASSALAYNAANPVLPLTATVSWPYHLPGAFLAATADADRETFTFNLALRP